MSRLAILCIYFQMVKIYGIILKPLSPQYKKIGDWKHHCIAIENFRGQSKKEKIRKKSNLFAHLLVAPPALEVWRRVVMVALVEKGPGNATCWPQGAFYTDAESVDAER